MKQFLKFCYRHIPGKKYLFKVLRRIVPIPESIYKHLHFKGTFTTQVEGDIRIKLMHHGYLIENEIFWKGLTGWEKESIGIWIQLCKIHDCIVDVGANTGVFSLIAKAINPGAKVIAVEAIERVGKKLAQNIALNDFDFEYKCAAVSSVSGEGIIYDSLSSEHVLSVSLNPSFNEGDSSLVPVAVNMITLDQITDEIKRPIELIKVDTETHEPEVLKGYQNYLRMHQPSMLIEILTNEVAAEVNELISGTDYLLYNVDEERGLVRQQSVTKSTHFNFLLCRPQVAVQLGLA